MPATLLLISCCEMRVEQQHGRIRPLHRDIPELCKWYGTWWLLSADGWLRVTDAHLASRLDRIRFAWMRPEKPGLRAWRSLGALLL